MSPNAPKKQGSTNFREVLLDNFASHLKTLLPQGNSIDMLRHVHEVCGICVRDKYLTCPQDVCNMLFFCSEVMRASDHIYIDGMFLAWMNKIGCQL